MPKRQVLVDQRVWLWTEEFYKFLQSACWKDRASILLEIRALIP